MKIGLSTGSIAMDNVRRGVEVATHPRTNAIELSALREEELDPLLASLDRLQDDLGTFCYISVHAPSRRERLSEAELVSRLQQVADRGWAIIVHPDVTTVAAYGGSFLRLRRQIRGAAVGIEASHVAKSLHGFGDQKRAKALCENMAMIKCADHGQKVVGEHHQRQKQGLRVLQHGASEGRFLYRQPQAGRNLPDPFFVS